MVDPGAAQAIVKQLNRWYRKRAKPHGTIDHFHRGIRMNYTRTKRVVSCCFSVPLLTLAGFLYFAPNLLSDMPPWEVLALKIGWLGIMAVALLAPLQAFSEHAIINDDGLLKCDLFGRERRMAWQDIFTYQVKPDDNRVIFQNNAKAKLTMSLAYDGWQDFLEMAARRMDRALYWQLSHTVANIDAKRPVLRSTKKSRWAKWFSFGRSTKSAIKS